MRATFCRRAKGQALNFCQQMGFRDWSLAFANAKARCRASTRKIPDRSGIFARLLRHPNQLRWFSPSPSGAVELFKIERRQIDVFFARSAINDRASTKKRRDGAFQLK